MARGGIVSKSSLRDTLIHEHAHYETSRHFGLEVSGLMVALNRSGDPTENPWLGKVRAYATDNVSHLRLVGLAGITAEAFAEEGDVPHLAPLLWHVIKTGDSSFSAEDAQMAGDFNMDHLQEAVHLVRTLWPVIEVGANAHQLLIESKNAVFSVWHPNGYTGLDAAEYAAAVASADAPQRPSTSP